jgi:hypothetical protein
VVEDEYQDVVGERTKAVLTTDADGGTSGELGTLGGDIAIAAAAARLHGEEKGAPLDLGLVRWL